MYAVTVDVDTRGPVFDGRLAAAIRRGASEAVWEIAKTGRGQLGVQFIKVFKNPTGYYESQTEAERVSDELAVIHDNDVIYGPWLEGTGSRNYPVTRFRGYWSYQIVTQQLNKVAGPIAERVITRHIAAVN